MVLLKIPKNDAPTDSTLLIIKDGEITKIIQKIKRQLFMLNQSKTVLINTENNLHFVKRI